ncbi:hypothetical protein SAI_0321 [Streptococcus agalactiae H36B]|nr:hypothetical protein SAL_0361 [Streptococcus agalactiae 515]EAO79161.1 hypothetical protein SAI_0321 [Streptococcus agalactiae H36B]
MLAVPVLVVLSLGSVELLVEVLLLSEVLASVDELTESEVVVPVELEAEESIGVDDELFVVLEPRRYSLTLSPLLNPTSPP